MFVCSIPTEGAPSLRFLQGWAAMLLVPFDFLCNCAIKPLAQAFPNPALRKVREGRGTHFVDDRRRDQRPGYPPPSAEFFCILRPKGTHLKVSLEIRNLQPSIFDLFESYPGGSGSLL
jgi:hypothetical protein